MSAGALGSATATAAAATARLELALALAVELELELELEAAGFERGGGRAAREEGRAAAADKAEAEAEAEADEADESEGAGEAGLQFAARKAVASAFVDSSVPDGLRTTHMKCDGCEQSRAEQSRAEQHTNTHNIAVAYIWGIRIPQRRATFVLCASFFCWVWSWVCVRP